MSLADEMRRLSEKGRSDFLFTEMEDVLKEIESAALRGENRIGRHPPMLLHKITCEDLRNKGFIVEVVPASRFLSPYIVISW